PGVIFGMPSIELRPPLMRSSQTSVERRVSAAVLPLATAVRALKGDAPSMRTRCSRCPPSSRMAIDTIQLFFLASASAAAEILRQSSRVSIGRVFMLRQPPLERREHAPADYVKAR